MSTWWLLRSFAALRMTRPGRFFSWLAIVRRSAGVGKDVLVVAMTHQLALQGLQIVQQAQDYFDAFEVDAQVFLQATNAAQDGNIPVAVPYAFSGDLDALNQTLLLKLANGGYIEMAVLRRLLLRVIGRGPAAGYDNSR